MPEALTKLAVFFSEPYGIALIILWIIGGIWTAYRRQKIKTWRKKHKKN